MKDHIIFPSDKVAEVADVGGKGHHLQNLMSWKARVAPFFVIGTKADGKITEEIRKEILAFIGEHKLVVFRSSMIGEDTLDASFAGLFETVINVSLGNWEESLNRVYASVHSSRVKNYIAQKSLTDEVRMAVVVQKQINVEKSGVLFTRAPVGATSAVAIDAAFGMGEGVVSGHADVDHYLLTRLGEIIEGHANSVLSQRELNELLIESLRLEKSFSAPADIEWGIVGSELYIFQIRPITRLFSKLNYISDTNLSESYPGVVSPFTSRFVRRAYENVFIEAFKIMGYEGERLESFKVHCSDLIITVDDHLYYNLEHYYAVLRALPGGEKNIENWHKMIGGKVKGADIPQYATKQTKAELAAAVYKLGKLSLARKTLYPEFIKNLESFSSAITSDMKRLETSQQTIQYLCHLVDRPLGFGLTIVNDFFIMLGLGKLSAAIKKLGLNEDVIIDLLKTEHGLDSLKPLKAFDELVAKLSPEFLDEFSKIETPAGFSPFDEAFKQLKEKWPAEVTEMKNFLDTFGDRSFEELKIESLPLKNDPDLFKQLLKWGKNNKTSRHSKAQVVASVPLSFIDKKVLDFTRSCIEFRETTRLWRGRFYHFLRQLIIKLAQQLMDEKPEFQNYKLRDFFSLTHLEWRSYYNDDLSTMQVRELMDTRKWQIKHQTYPEFSCWSEEEALPKVDSTQAKTGPLKGQGVSPGIVEGVALVLESPTEILDNLYENFILVTKNTDPAWVYIMSRSKALISEKGSMLSHTAIIGRELGIPTLVGVKNATQQIKTGDKLRVDGSTGEVKKL